MKAPKGLMETNWNGLNLAGPRQVRDVYDLGDRLLIVTTDRISPSTWSWQIHPRQRRI
jgi:hypothetical protein